MSWRANRLREQARFHIGFVAHLDFVTDTDQMWERACSGRRSDEEAISHNS
jgi:hypothetical protein